MKTYHLAGKALGALGLMALAVSCNGTKSAVSGNTPSSAIQNFQNPSVSCQVNMGGQNLLMVNNLTQASNFAQPPAAPAQISLNCAGSKSNAPGANLTLSYSINGGPFTVFNAGMQDANDPVLNFNSPGVQSFAVKATDSSGLVTNVAFTLPVSCSPTGPGVTPMAGPSGMTVSQGIGPGYVNVAFASPGSGGGGGPYQYAIDLNGDGLGSGRFDYYTAPNSSTPVYWNTSANWQNMYNFYSGSRTIYVQVYDTKCQFMSTFPYAYNWSSGVLSGAQSGATAAVEPYAYLQGVVGQPAAPTAANTAGDPAEAVNPFDARDLVDPAKNPQHVICNWAENVTSGSNPQATFNIQAMNTYSDGNQNDAGQLLSSMTLAWSISDTGANLSGTVPLTGMTYQTSASPDGGFTQYAYNMNTGCTATVQVQRASSIGTCDGNPADGLTWPQAIITGTFSCPDLASVNSKQSRNIGITSGYFYCETSVGDNCVGSGQSSGSPPTAF